MSLYIEVAGSGEPIVMLHGWGMHGGIWGEALDRLTQDFKVCRVDLPGHGKSPFQPEEYEWKDGGQGTLVRQRERAVKLLDMIVGQLSAQFHNPVTLCGWSLGGIIAQHWAAREPDKIRRLVLVSSTPCFAEHDGWPYGMARELLEQFASDLKKNHTATLRRFLGLQVRGSEDERELMARLRKSLFSHGEPHLDALRAGLEILHDADLRAELPNIRQATLVIAGERDKLTSPKASHYLAQTMPNARFVEIRGAAHAPFLSHSDEFVQHMMDFLNEKQA